MAKERFFHGADGDTILEILRTGVLLPDGRHEIYGSMWRYESIFCYGADTARGTAFVIQVLADLPSVRRRQTPGEPLTLVVVSDEPVPVEVLTMYVRELPAGTAAVVHGPAAIRAYLSRPHAARGARR